MRRRGQHPNAVTYNTLISACAKAGRYAKAQELHAAMVDAGLADDVFTLTALITGVGSVGRPGWVLPPPRTPGKEEVKHSTPAANAGGGAPCMVLCCAHKPCVSLCVCVCARVCCSLRAHRSLAGG
jgi:pentatricopeptide repeat protein